ncbi:hypothetical protein [Kingella oralis]|nr:hypothetical protein [Kingella oralis]
MPPLSIRAGIGSLKTPAPPECYNPRFLSTPSHPSHANVRSFA